MKHRSLLLALLLSGPGIARSEPAEADDTLERIRAQVARPSGLTADEAARRAVETSPERRSRKADIEVAEAEVDRAGVAYYPRLTGTARYTRLSPLTAPEIGLPGAPPGASFSFPVVLDQYLLQANLVVPLSDYLLRIPQSHGATERSRESARHAEVAARRAIALGARVVYYAWARARLQGVVAEQAVEQAKRHLELARAGSEMGRAPEVEVLRAESLLASAELLEARTKNASRLFETRLRHLMHAEGSAPFEIGEDLLAPPSGKDPGTPDALYAEAVSRRPEMRAFEESESALRGQRSAAKATGLPRLDAFGNAYLANPSPRVVPQEEKWRATWDVGVQLTFSPNDIGAANATARTLDARQKKLDAERAALADSVRDEITASVLAWREANAVLVTAERGLRAAEEAHRVRSELYALGRGTSVELIDAESDVLRARLEMIQARVDARVAQVRIEHASGRDGDPRPVH